MNTEAILETSHASFAGTISFPEVVRRLLAAGVEYYHVDYSAMRESFYALEGQKHPGRTPRADRSSGKNEPRRLGEHGGFFTEVPADRKLLRSSVSVRSSP